MAVSAGTGGGMAWQGGQGEQDWLLMNTTELDQL